MRRWMIVGAAVVALAGCKSGSGASLSLGGRTAQTPRADDGQPAADYSHLPARTSPRLTRSATLEPGRYAGDLVIAAQALTVEGAGADQTVIEGRLIFAELGRGGSIVRNLTVLGDVVFDSHDNELHGVQMRGRVVDNGVRNAY
ncbi:MAG: hypothetical protein M9894_17775 [Planctomycetes bacterium]|nr:hypothetical protein [Planctomycetota bacterium]